MSSRGNFLGTGPASGVYTPKPTPQLPEDMPIYINDELLDLGGRLNNILEGGAFPPQSQLPKRVKDGMMIYFTQPIQGSSISSAGVWLYRKEKWWKIIDDPSAISQNLTVYKKFPKGSTRPPKPPANKYLVEDLNGWDYVPQPNDDANDQWMSVAVWAVTDPDNPIVDWAEPIMFNTEGTAGQPGSDGYSIEFRYIASTLKPSIKDKLNKVPVTNEGKAYVETIPPVTHPNENYVWQIQTYTRNDELGQPWTDPVRFSTPDTTKANSCYAAAREGYPTFNANASGLPGPNWTHTVPTNIPEGHNLWRSDRLDWTDGSPQTPWSTPYKANGQVGAKQESRFTAATNKPVLVSSTARNPVGTSGEVFSIAIPPASHPDKNYIWVTTGIVNRLNEMEIAWSEPAKYATPDATSSSRCYAKGGLNTYPSFIPGNAGLPGTDWSKEFPGGALGEGEYIWESTRLEWTDGTSQTNWTTPVRIMGYDGTDGLSFEYRYRASTNLPNIATGDRIPAGWTKDVPTVSHPNNSYVWVSSAQIDTKDKLVVPWSVPAKYATPDTATHKYAYGVGTDSTYPSFNPNAAGLPGSGWAYAPQKVSKGQRVWITSRYQWNDSTGSTSWITPTLFSGSDGADGNNGNDGITGVEVYTNSVSKPASIPDAERAYPPPGWSKTPSSPPMGSFTWVSKNYVRGIVSEAKTTVYNYSGPSQYSGFPGQDGNPGTNGSNGVDGKTYYNWIMYADTSSGGGMSPDPTNKKYVGFAYNMTTPNPSNNPFDYKWYQLEGTPGVPGAGFYRIGVPNFISWPSNDEVDALFEREFGKKPSTDDVLTLYNTYEAKTSQTRRKDKNTAWIEATYLLHGDMILRGTVVADNIAADAINAGHISANAITARHITAGTITGDKITANTSINAPILQGGQIIGADLNIGNGTFTVNGFSGHMTANSANITGAINATSGTFRGTVSGSRIEGGSIGIGSQFSVDDNGKLTCSGASIGGTLNSVNGVFTGTLQGVNGTFTGTVQAGSIVSGGNISGGQINIPASSPKFIVRDTGNMTCNDATINGAFINNGGIEGAEIHIPNKSNYKFKVDSAGNLEAKSGTFYGTIYADKLLGGVTSGGLFFNRELFVDEATVTELEPYNGTFELFKFYYSRNRDSGGNIPPMDLIISNMPNFSIRVRPYATSGTEYLFLKTLTVKTIMEVTTSQGTKYTSVVSSYTLPKEESIKHATSFNIQLNTSGCGLLLPTINGLSSDRSIVKLSTNVTATCTRSTGGRSLKLTYRIQEGDPFAIAMPHLNNFEQIV